MSGTAAEFCLASSAGFGDGLLMVLRVSCAVSSAVVIKTTMAILNARRKGMLDNFPIDARVPHMGWNELEVRPKSKLIHHLNARPYVYFAHSYYVPENPRASATCTYEQIGR